MGKKIKILLVGLGSIGRRHLSILSTFQDVEIAALRTSKGQLKETTEFCEFANLPDALDFHPDGVIISNPTAIHAETALPFLQQGCKVLIEKPIDTSVANANKLEDFTSQLRVAYCFRFHPLYQFLGETFIKCPPFKVAFKRSFYLPKWHPYADYREEYTAKRELGGGVIRTLSHEIDLAIHWFGEPAAINGVVDKVSGLEINTDDYAFLSLKMKNASRVNFELDFFSPINVNEGNAFNNDGWYHWDMHKVTFTPYSASKIGNVIFESSLDVVDQMYSRQINDFVYFVKNGLSRNANFAESKSVMELIELIEK